MITEEEVEELFLDYKRAATVTPFRKLDVSDRKNLAKAIAGFANSEGGVIVSGVDCRGVKKPGIAAGRGDLHCDAGLCAVVERDHVGAVERSCQG